LDWNSGKRHECNETPDLENRWYRLSQEFNEKNAMKKDVYQTTGTELHITET